MWAALKLLAVSIATVFRCALWDPRIGLFYNPGYTKRVVHNSTLHTMHTTCICLYRVYGWFLSRVRRGYHFWRRTLSWIKRWARFFVFRGLSLFRRVWVFCQACVHLLFKKAASQPSKIEKSNVVWRGIVGRWVLWPALPCLNTLVRLGYFDLVYRISLYTAYKLRHSTSNFFDLAVMMLVKLTTYRYRWSRQYQPYAEADIFLHPRLVENKERYLGDIPKLEARLKHWVKRLQDAAFDKPMLVIMLDALVELPRSGEYDALFLKCIAAYQARYVYRGSPICARWIPRHIALHTHTEGLEIARRVFGAHYTPGNFEIARYERVPRTTIATQHEPLLRQGMLEFSSPVVYKGNVIPHRGTLSYPALYAHWLKDAQVVSPHGLIVSGKKVIERFVHVNDIHMDTFCYTLLAKQKEQSIIATRINVRLEHHSPIFYCGYTDNYYHWLIECLPRFSMALDLIVKHALPKRFLIPLPLKSWQWHMLAAMGITPEHCVVGHERLDFLCKNLIAIDLPSFDMMSHPKTLDLLKRHLPAQWFDEAVEPNRKLLLVRPKSGPQRLSNQERVRGMAAAKGFEAVAPETMSFEQQVKLFRSASHVIGSGGAALANLVFTQPGSKALIFGPVDQIQPATFSPLVAAHGDNVTYLACDSIASVRHLPYIWTIFDYQVNMDDFALSLKTLEGYV